MLRLISRRLLISIPLILLVTFAVFVLIDLAPGDPAVTLAGPEPAPERVEYIREQLDLDESVPIRYVMWLGNAVQGDLGESLQTREGVLDLIFARLPVTISLVVVSIAFATGAALVFGILGALRPRGVIDRAISAVSAVAIAMPPFWVAILLVLWFAVNRNWFPAIGYDNLGDGVWPWLEHLVLPGLSLSLFLTAELTLQLKGAMTETLGRDYVLTAEAKGLSHRKVVLKHALKNAAIPAITVLGLRIAGLIGGTATIESVFALKGIGDLAVGATFNRDIAVMLGIVLVTTIMVQLVNLAVDISYGYFNPKVRK